MINELSVNFVNKFFDRITKLNAEGVNLICDAKDINIDKAVICILPVPNSNDDVIILMRHIAQIQIRLSEFMQGVELWDENAAWAYSMANTVVKVVSVRRKECYIQLKKNRGDVLGFGHDEQGVFAKNIPGVTGGRD